jgi:hypothetical protein
MNLFMLLGSALFALLAMGTCKDPSVADELCPHGTVLSIRGVTCKWVD